MAKRDKRIQKKKKRRERIRRSKARKRDLTEVRNDEDFDFQPPDEFESNLFELLANESSTWLEEPEFADVHFSPPSAMMHFIGRLEAQGIDADAFFEDYEEEDRVELMWTTIAEITPNLFTQEHVAQVVGALTELEKRWSKQQQKSADVAGIALVRTMLVEYASNAENAEALGMIGLIQSITHRSVVMGFEGGHSLPEADEILKIGEDALFEREIELGLYTEAEVDEAAEQFSAMQLRPEGTDSGPFLQAIVDVVRKAVREPERASDMAARITQYIEENQESLSEAHSATLLTMNYFLEEGEDGSFSEIEELLVAAMFGEIGRMFDELDEEFDELDFLTDSETEDEA